MLFLSFHLWFLVPWCGGDVGVRDTAAARVLDLCVCLRRRTLTTTTQRVVAPSSHVGRHCCVFPSARLAFSVGRPVASVLHACFVSVEFDSRLCCWGPVPKGSCGPHGPPRLCLPRGPRRPSVDLPGYVSRVESRRRDADVCLLCEPVSVWVWP